MTDQRQADMGLLLRPDAYYAQTPNGMYVVTNEGSSSFTGTTAYKLLERLAPLLDGSRELEELTANLAPAHRAAVEKIVRSLMERDIVRTVDKTQWRRSALQTGEMRDTVGLLDYFLPAGADAFEAYCGTVALVLGTGPVPAAIARVAQRSGVRDVRVVEALPGDLDAVLDGVDLVFHTCDEQAVERAYELDDLCAAREISLVQTVIAGDHAWLGRSAPGLARAWSSGWLRRQARRHHLSRAREPAAMTRLAATALASQLVCDVQSTPISPAAHRMTRLDLASLASETEVFLRHPFAAATTRQSLGEFRTRMAALRAGERLTDDSFSRRAVGCRGSLLGVFGPPTERELVQTPLHVSEIEVSDPVGLSGEVVTLTGAGPDFATARYRAAKNAFAVYASLMLDPRRLLEVDGTLPADPFEALTALRTGAARGFVLGSRLIDDEPRVVDVTRAFPALKGLTGQGPPGQYIPPAGVGVGYDWREAVTSGLVAQCRRLTLESLARRAEPYVQIDLEHYELDVLARRYWSLLGTVAEPVRIYDITGDLGLPTVQCYIGASLAGCCSALRLRTALTAVVEQALLYFQATRNGQSECLPPSVPSIPVNLRGQEIAGHSIDQECDMNGLVNALTARGCSPVAVPLDHDSEVFSVLPYVANVVLDDG